MRLIVAGSRETTWTSAHSAALRHVINEHKITMVITGGCSGIDEGANNFARQNGIDRAIFPANWVGRHKSAGPYRNGTMAQYADAVLLFHGGRGTARMREIASHYQLLIIEANPFL